MTEDKLQLYEKLLTEASNSITGGAATSNTYLTIGGGIDGTVKKGDVSNGFEVYAYSWGLVNDGQTGGIKNSGAAAFQNCYCVVEINKATTSKLATAFQNACTGTDVSPVNLYFLTNNETATQVTFDKGVDNSFVLVTDFQIMKQQNSSNKVLGIIGFAYGKVTLKIGSATGNYTLGDGST